MPPHFWSILFLSLSQCEVSKLGAGAKQGQQFGDLLYLFEEFPDQSTGTAGDYNYNNQSDNTKRTAPSTIVIVVLSWWDQGLLIEKNVDLRLFQVMYICNIYQRILYAKSQDHLKKTPSRLSTSLSQYSSAISTAQLYCDLLKDKDLITVTRSYNHTTVRRKKRSQG